MLITTFEGLWSELNEVDAHDVDTGSDCVCHQSMTRNNDVEADSASPAGQWTRRRHLPLYQLLLQLIVDERQLVQMQARPPVCLYSHLQCPRC